MFDFSHCHERDLADPSKGCARGGPRLSDDCKSTVCRRARDGPSKGRARGRRRDPLMRWVPSACRLSAADRARERSGCLSSAGGGAVRHPESSQTEQGNVASFSQTHRGNVARRAPRAGGGPGTARARGASERGGEGSADAVGPLRPLLRMAVARPWCAIRSEMASCGRRRLSASTPNPGWGRGPWWSPPCALPCLTSHQARRATGVHAH